MNNQPIAVWQGSQNTLAIVAGQIKARFGIEAMKEYNPLENCFTYREWLRRGYQVRRGEKALDSITWIQDKEDEDKKYPRKVCLFFKTQVDKKL